MFQECLRRDPDDVPPIAAPRCDKPVDRDHLARYTLGDPDLEREVLGLFLDEVPDRLAALSRAATERDWKMATHTLKGSARAIGAWTVADLALEGEAMDFSEATLAARRSFLVRIEGALNAVACFVSGRTAA